MTETTPETYSARDSDDRGVRYAPASRMRSIGQIAAGMDARPVGGSEVKAIFPHATARAAEAQSRLDALAAAGQPFVPRYRRGWEDEAAETVRRALDAAFALAPPAWRRMTLDAYRPYTRATVGALEGVAMFVADPVGILYLYGSNGTGKTHLGAGATIRLIERGYIGRAYPATVVAKRLRAAAGAGHGDLEQLSNRLKNTRVLMLDDFGAEHLTDFLAGEWFDILDYRYSTLMPTIITSNLAPKDLGLPKLTSRFTDARFASLIALNETDYRSYPADALPVAAPEPGLIPVSHAPAKCPKCDGAGFRRHDLPVRHHDFGRLFRCACRGVVEPLPNGGEKGGAA